jgi:hypothetical protein
VHAALVKALAAVESHGLLLLQDAKLPSLASLVAGGPVKGSWWSHPQGKVIFNTAGDLEDHPDVAPFKLVSRKVTFVHRRLWPALVAVGGARAPWQTRGLAAPAKKLLAKVDADSSLQASGVAAKTLEERLLVASRQEHTPSGKHVTVLESWDAFAARTRVEPARDAAAAQAVLEKALVELGGAAALLPWAK